MTKEEIYHLYKKYQVKNPSIHHEAFFKTPEGTIHIYKSGKILMQGGLAPVNGIAASTDTLIDQAVAGSDETGKGDIFGPIVCAAVQITKEIPTGILNQIGDSKGISDSKIEILTPLLLEYINYSIFKIHPDQINQLSQKYNFNELITLAHTKAHNNLKSELNIVIDGFTTDNNFAKYLNHLQLKLSNYQLIPKAEDKYISVAIASILARYEFITTIDNISKEVGFKVQKGAGQNALDQVLKLDEVQRDKYVKTTFKNVKELLNK
jgi:ribonuclease HIII